jgi:biopolymer transport protein ExbB
MDIILDAFDYFLPGGTVMVPIVLTSLIMWALIIEKLFCFRKLKQDIDIKEAVDILRHKYSKKLPKGLRARIVKNFLNERTSKSELDKSILKLCAMRERPFIRRNLAIITVFAAIAPLLGLLGTVNGMMTTFDVISVFGTGNAKAMAGGISEALITTQSGLFVAIPGIFMSAFLTRHADRFESRLDELIMILKRNV